MARIAEKSRPTGNKSVQHPGTGTDYMMRVNGEGDGEGKQ